MRPKKEKFVLEIIGSGHVRFNAFDVPPECELRELGTQPRNRNEHIQSQSSRRSFLARLQARFQQAARVSRIFGK